ncbi:hypothetical protein F2264_21505 [Salmonella enterica]|nr:hypothetical protein [Salmonella enterica]EAO3601651.1 hypothetical protein [Salmonella enterica]ECC2205752.1 hypothetical protein [Salmonella enterica]ECU5200744.1 hypothetical protein [Salmonella enterica]
MSQFIVELQKNGMTVTDINDDTRQFAGITMLELSGVSGIPSPVTLYKDILHAIFGAYSREMRAAKQAVTDGIDQMFIPTANDGFLDTWGNQFGLPRAGRSDNDYRQYIISEVFRVRVNSFAIVKTVKDLTGYDITLHEPWKDVFRLDTSELSGPDRFYKAGDSSYFIVQPKSFNRRVDWNVVIPIIQRNLAAGVTIMTPDALDAYFVGTPLDGTIWWQAWSMYGTWVTTDEMPRLDNSLVLSGGYMIPMNYSVAITSLQMLDNLGDQLAGIVKWTPSHLLSYYASLGKVNIGEWHTGTYGGAWIKVYPTEPRTWATGYWDPDSTWAAPYSVKVWSAITKFEDKFFVDASGTGVGVNVHSTTGETWENPQEWGSIPWDQGAVDTYYLSAHAAVPAQASLFTLVQQGDTTQITVNLPRATGLLRIVTTRYISGRDTAVSGGMATAIGHNADDSVATVVQQASNYAFNITPVRAGTTVFTVKHPDFPALKLEMTINVT